MAEPLDAAIVIQARMGSTRLAGKTMMPLAGFRMLFHVVTRLEEAEISGPLIIATSTNPTDDFICSFSGSEKAQCFRGSEEDVLDRFCSALESVDTKYVIRATADNPLVWQGAIPHLGRLIQELGCDYMSYTQTMPLGLGLEIFTREALLAAGKESTDEKEREHVTSFIYKRQDRFDCVWMAAPEELRGDYRLTVDTQEDYELMKTIYDRLYTPGQIITSEQAIELLRNEPDLAQRNSHVQQKTHEE